MATSTQPIAPPAATPRGFWRRLFGEYATHRQTGFDVVAGFLLPALCVALDPVILSGMWPSSGSVFGPYTLFARGFIGIELLVLLVWLCGGRRRPALAPFQGGALAVGAAFALLVGICLLPFSLFGILLLGIGFLGFVPFLTAFSFARCSVHALRAARLRSAPLRLAAVLVGATAVVAVPAASVVRVRADVARAVAAAEAGDAARGLESLRTLAWLAPGEIQPVLAAYERATGDSRRRLGRLYEGLVGIDPEDAIAWRDD